MKAIPAVFLDIHAAYDNVLPDILMNKLLALGVPPRTRKFIYNLTAFRKISCRYGHIDTWKWAYKGLPQGSVLSPVLYTLYVAQFDLDYVENAKIIQYADDVCIYSPINATHCGLKAVELSVANINNTLDNLGLSLSTTKTKLCI